MPHSQQALLVPVLLLMMMLLGGLMAQQQNVDDLCKKQLRVMCVRGLIDAAWHGAPNM
jgi:hypothetical protein